MPSEPRNPAEEWDRHRRGDEDEEPTPFTDDNAIWLEAELWNTVRRLEREWENEPEREEDD